MNFSIDLTLSKISPLASSEFGMCNGLPYIYVHFVMFVILYLGMYVHTLIIAKIVPTLDAGLPDFSWY
jgi:hypothetical protein